MVKLGSKVLAFDDRLNLLWTYTIQWNEYSRCFGLHPLRRRYRRGRAGDEVNGGFYILDSDGRPMWGRAKSLDTWIRSPSSRGTMGRCEPSAAASGHILDENGQVILKLGEEQVPHGQEARVADFDVTSPGAGDDHPLSKATDPHVLVVANDGQIVRRFPTQRLAQQYGDGSDPMEWPGT